MAKQLKLGVMGMSDGNGHPYSWSAICNGYNEKAMSKCPYPAIPGYLFKEQWPDAKIPDVQVTHIWTQERGLSQDVADAALIPNIVNKPEEMIGQIDALLLARDDAENHEAMSKPFLEAGIPVFIDKPLALSVQSARAMLDLQQYEGQVFSCSAFRYDDGLVLSEEERKFFGQNPYVECVIPKYWDTYAVHLIEPVVTSLPNRGKLLKCESFKYDSIVKAHVYWENAQALFSTFGTYTAPLEIDYYASGQVLKKRHSDTFSAFKNSIVTFIDSVRNKTLPISRTDTLEIVEIIESIKNDA